MRVVRQFFLRRPGCLLRRFGENSRNGISGGVFCETTRYSSLSHKVILSGLKKKGTSSCTKFARWNDVNLRKKAFASRYGIDWANRLCRVPLVTKLTTASCVFPRKKSTTCGLPTSIWQYKENRWVRSLSCPGVARWLITRVELPKASLSPMTYRDAMSHSAASSAETSGSDSWGSSFSGKQKSSARRKKRKGKGPSRHHRTVC